jgi:pyridoxine kinase
MGTILCISSQTVRGYVGGSAARIALERLGHQVWLLPSVILSNHPGHPLFAGEQVPTGRLGAMLDALDANGWLGEADAVLTGYLPTPEHVALALRAAERVQHANPDAQLICDPILGDDPGGLYIDESAAAALRDQLLPHASLLTPNRFELDWLVGRKVKSADDAKIAAETLAPAAVLATSVPENKGHLYNLLLRDDQAWRTLVPARDAVPHGTGDMLTALYLGHRLNGAAEPEALALATAGVEAALARSEGADALQLVRHPDRWATPEPWPVEKA